MEKIELLSPVGNIESLKCAINNGANAVYLGLNNFNARNNIDNFNFSNLADSVKLAHLYNVKVYLTLNTLIGDDEFTEVIKYVKDALECKVDAFIVQDIGLIYCLRQNFPNIELHASTQMGLNNLEGIENLKDLNLKRVVLARETPLTEIERIKKNINLDIEYFVQGALCVSFSGNCYLCSLLANASGNRGKCKQFCRLPYKMDYENIHKNGYLLSTKDFCMIPYLKKLYESGVSSFKIEGRARRPSYVAVATGVYRKVIDNNFNFDNNDIFELKNVYNRGNYISGYFQNESIIYPKVQNHMGVEIGQIKSIKKGKKFNEITIKSKHIIQKGDVLKVFQNEKEIGVLSVVDLKAVQKDEFILTSTSVFPINSKINLIVNNELEEKYLKNKEYIDVDVKITMLADQNVIIEFICDYANVKLSSDIKPQKAKTMPITVEDCKEQFSKMGEIFKLRKIEVISNNVFLTKAQLNQLRREGIEKLKAKIIENYEDRENLSKKSQFIPQNIEIFDREEKNNDIIEIDNFSNTILVNDKIYIYKPYIFDENIVNTYQKYKDYNVFIYLPIMATKSEIEKIQEILSKCPNWGVVANNYYALSLVGKDKTIIGSNLNVYNSFAVKYYADKGYKHIILSIEKHSYIKNCGVNLYCYSKYYPQYMYFRHCPYKEHLKSLCSKCNFKDGLKYKLNNKEFVIKRQKIISCQFILKAVKSEIGQTQSNAGEIEEF